MYDEVVLPPMVIGTLHVVPLVLVDTIGYPGTPLMSRQPTATHILNPLAQTTLCITVAVDVPAITAGADQVVPLLLTEYIGNPVKLLPTDTHEPAVLTATAFMVDTWVVPPIAANGDQTYPLLL
jgi:hypothetical protein